MNILIEKKELEKIAKQISLTAHAQQRILERLGEYDIDKIKHLITHPHLAWRNTDDTINIAINSTQYFVIKQKNKKYIIITFKEQSNRNVTTDTKFAMAFWGKRRK